MKIRDSNTTAIEKEIKKWKINHGVWIDIFPMDGLPKDTKKAKRIEKFDRQILRRRFLENGYQKSFMDYVEKIASIILYPRKIWALKKSVKLSKKYPFIGSDYFWWNWGSRFEHNFKTKYFHKFVLMDFETLKIRVPADYDLYLTQHYGNWKELPPIEKRNSGHVFELIDLSEPFSKHVQ